VPVRFSVLLVMAVTVAGCMSGKSRAPSEAVYGEELKEAYRLDYAFNLSLSPALVGGVDGGRNCALLVAESPLRAGNVTVNVSWAPLDPGTERLRVSWVRDGTSWSVVGGPPLAITVPPIASKGGGERLLFVLSHEVTARASATQPVALNVFMDLYRGRPLSGDSLACAVPE
jgi:hypothetical protein